MVLPAYQNNLWEISNNGCSEINIIESKKILIILITNNKTKENNNIPNLFFNSIPRVDRFNIKSKKYAEPATHEPIISMGSLLIIIILDTREASKNNLNKK